MGHMSARSRWSPDRIAPWVALAFVLGLCAAHGLVVTAGLARPPNVDNLRDVGAIQGILDGNWFGDPVNAGAWRWYPPLIHAVAATAAWLSGASPLQFWASAGPWLNLLTPLTFFLMTARLFGPPTAAVSVVVLVLLNGAMRSPWLAASYTPWPFTPNLALPCFFASLWLIYARAGARRIGDAIVVGGALGLTFLAHIIPALLLSAIVTAVTLSETGIRPRAFLHLAIVAVTELAVALLFLGPLVLHYRLRILNPDPGMWTDSLMGIGAKSILIVAALNFPGALAALSAWLTRAQAPISRRTLVILLAWAGICGAFLSRHYACGLLQSDAWACRAFVLPAHHFHFYLHAAWACLIGHALWCWYRSLRERLSDSNWELRTLTVASVVSLLIMTGAGLMLWRRNGVSIQSEDIVDPALHLAWAALISAAVWDWWRRREQTVEHTAPVVLASILVTAMAGLTAASCVWISFLPADAQSRKSALADGVDFDLAAYGWILRGSRPADLFVTELVHEWSDPAAMTVMAAGRRLVAAPKLHSNPYLTWRDRDERRRGYIAALAEGERSALCALMTEAGAGVTAWFLLPTSDPVDPSLAEPTYRTAHHILYRLKPLACGSA
jgi:hypothetical protein